MPELAQTPPEASPSAGARAAELRALLFLAITSLCWGANALFARLAVDRVSPMALVTLRWALVMSLLVLFARRAVQQDWPLLRMHLPFMLAMGAFGYTLFNVLFYVAAHHTTAINLGVVQASTPAFIFVIAFLRFRARVSPLQLLGVLAAMLGVALVAAQGEWRRLLAIQFNLGDLLVAGACVSYAGYTVALRNRPAVSGLAFFTVMAMAAFVTSLPLAFVEWWRGELLWPSAQGWAIVVAIGLFPSLLGQLLYIRSVEIIGPTRAGLFVNLSPIVAALLAVLFLGERFHWYHAAALALVFAGIWLSERQRALPARLSVDRWRS